MPFVMPPKIWSLFKPKELSLRSSMTSLAASFAASASSWSSSPTWPPEAAFCAAPGFLGRTCAGLVVMFDLRRAATVGTILMCVALRVSASTKKRTSRTSAVSCSTLCSLPTIESYEKEYWAFVRSSET